MNKELICICCPMGCHLSVEMENGEVLSVSGNTCNRGKDYAVSEMTAPSRMVTSTIRTVEGISVPVKTENAVPKDKIFETMDEIKRTVLHLPVKVGDVVIDHVAGTDVNVVATRSLQ